MHACIYSQEVCDLNMYFLYTWKQGRFPISAKSVLHENPKQREEMRDNVSHHWWKGIEPVERELLASDWPDQGVLDLSSYNNPVHWGPMRGHCSLRSSQRWPPSTVQGLGDMLCVWNWKKKPDFYLVAKLVLLVLWMRTLKLRKE